MILGLEKLNEATEGITKRLIEDCEDDPGVITEVMIIATVSFGTTEDGDGDIHTTFYRCSSAAGYIQRGILEDARRAVDANTLPRDD